ncbi:hypothetical protein CFSAN004177_13660 [Escherichia coli]|nr:hypothetical protein CFSAN004177_13660 [Escherichia coli]
MTRIKINARRIFSLLIPFFFFTSVHAEQTAAPAKPVTVEAKNETFARSIPINISPGKPPRNSQSVLTPWRKIHGW